MSKDLSEKILCIKEDLLFEDGKWNGLKTDQIDKYLKLIQEKGEWIPRKDLENDSSYKQVIGQVILRYKDKYFLYKQVNRNETRLNGTHPLAFGGHIEEFDMDPKKAFVDCLLDRELSEEALVESNIVGKKTLGLIYLEDDNPVNWMHLGLVSVFDLDGDNVKVREDGLEGVGFVSLDFLKNNKEILNFWSRIIIYHL